MLTNLSQVLLRNDDLLDAKTPLLINLTADGFINEYLTLYPKSKISCLNTHFEHFQALKKQHSTQIDCHFTSNYQTKIQHDLVVIAFPKSKAELAFTLAMINPFLATDAQILFVGDNKGGVKSTPKLTQHFLSSCNKVDSARHCVLFLGQFNNQIKAFNIEDWYQIYQLSLANIELKIASLPGVFSQDGLDVGTRLLLENLPPLEGKILDFGCGAGVISSFIGKKYPNSQLSLLDVSALAITSAEKTLALNNLSGKVFPSDGLGEIGTDKFNHIVSNPPFHQGIKTNYAATETFLKGIKKCITARGTITIVANSFLRYQGIMEEAIGKTKTLITTKGFSIYQCKKR
jgi:16S rRNA (guanine1207-N2)-methyltransferase